MIISAKRVLELNTKHHLISNLCEREWDPEGVGLDLRVGRVLSVEGNGYVGTQDRNTPRTRLLASIENGDKEVSIGSGEYVLIDTMEEVNIPKRRIRVFPMQRRVFLMPDVYPRSTLQRSGILLLATKTDPGYNGVLTFALANLGSCPFKLDLGARVANLVFHTVVGDVRPYQGQWRGGRVSTNGLEKQI